MEDFFVLLAACLQSEAGADSGKCLKTDETTPTFAFPAFTLECPHCKGEFLFDRENGGVGEDECELCGKDIVIEWEFFPDGTETYWVNTPEDSKAYWS